MYSKTIYSPSDLETYLKLRSLTWEMVGLPDRKVMGQRLKIRFPYFYADLIDWNDPQDPIRKMVIPSIEEDEVQDYELTDPIGDRTHEPVPGLIHRYPDRCLLLLTTNCTVHCRFCFRRDVIGTPLPIDIPSIKDYLLTHPQIHEVIFTGGDPGTLPPVFLSRILDELSSIASITTLRFHIRSFVVDPLSIDDEWLNQLQRLSDRRKVIVLHVDHPREITMQLKELVKKLQDRGILILSQTVLLKGVNDTVETLRDLFTSLSLAGIKPYYLHHLDKARGTHHFRLSIEEGKQLYSSLRGSLPGYGIPEYVVDLPGGDGKVPVMWMQRKDSTSYEVKNFEGRTITYTDPVGK